MHMNKQKLITILKVIAIPTAYALVLRFVFGIEGWIELLTVMSVSFLFCLPTTVGALTVYFSSEENAAKIPYRIFMPWVPIFIFMFITLLFRIEGWACWLMVLPLFFGAASVGGLLGGYFKLRKRKVAFIFLC